MITLELEKQGDTKSNQALIGQAERCVIRKEYISRLIKGVREQIAKDHETIKVKTEHGDCQMVHCKWLDAELLCYVIEKDILNNDTL